jgi:hypothetical protein
MRYFLPLPHQVIVVFYALVVLIVLGARCRKDEQARLMTDPTCDDEEEENEDPKHLVVYDPDRDVAIQASSRDTNHAQHYSGKPL